MTGRLAGKSAYITGAASGLGRAIAERFAAEGARVAIADIDQNGGRRVEEAIGPAAVFLHHDVTSEADWIGNLAAAVAATGSLDILVNNAGIGPPGNIERTSLDEWRRVHRVNLDSVFLGCRHALPHLRAAGGGSIINISSVAAMMGTPTLFAYGSSKAAIRQLTKSVALHCAAKNDHIRCNSIHPVFIATPILDGLVQRFGRDEAYAKLGRQVPLGHIGEPDDIAYAVLYLASDESKFVTGAELKVDGGISAM